MPAHVPDYETPREEAELRPLAMPILALAIALVCGPVAILLMLCFATTFVAACVLLVLPHVLPIVLGVVFFRLASRSSNPDWARALSLTAITTAASWAVLVCLWLAYGRFDL